MSGTIATRVLGRTALAVTELGFGAAPLGGFRGAVAAADAAGALDEAWDGGVRYFDTAPFYGYGRSELAVGALLRERPRDAFVVSTKVGRVLRRYDPARRSPAHRPGGLPFDADYDYGYDGTMRSIEQSMLRTGLDRFDVLLVHDLDAFIHTVPADLERYYAVAVEGGFRALRELRDAGVIRAFGAGLNEAATCARVMRDADPDCVLLAGRLTLLDQDALDEVVPLAREKRIALIAGGPFNSGILAAEPAPGAAYHYAAAPPAIVERARDWSRLARSHGVPLQAAALRFALLWPEVAAIIPGARSRAEMHAILDWHGVQVPDGLWSDARALGYLGESVPIPAPPRRSAP